MMKQTLQAHFIFKQHNIPEGMQLIENRLAMMHMTVEEEEVQVDDYTFDEHVLMANKEKEDEVPVADNIPDEHVPTTDDAEDDNGGKMGQQSPYMMRPFSPYDMAQQQQYT